MAKNREEYEEEKCVPDYLTELIVVRHGETTCNADGVIQGQSPSSLNDTGISQAHAVADHLSMEQIPIAAVYSSDLERASHTANIIANKCNIEEVFLMKELRERHLGKLQGLKREAARHLEPEAYRVFTSRNSHEQIPGGGESYDDVLQRSKFALENIAEKHYGKRVVVVTHGGVIRALHENAKRRPPSKVLNTSISIFQITKKKLWSIIVSGLVDHLKDNIAPQINAEHDSA